MTKEALQIAEWGEAHLGPTIHGALKVGEAAGHPQPARRVGAEPDVQPLAAHVEPEPNLVAGRAAISGGRLAISEGRLAISKGACISLVLSSRITGGRPVG